MPKIAIWILLLVILILRIFLYQVNLPKFSEDSVVRISAYLREDPVIYARSQKVILQGIKVYLPFYPQVSYGDYLVVQGKVQKGRLIQTKILEHKQSDNPLNNFRKNLFDVYKQSLPTDFAGLVSGVSLGSKSLISKDLYEKLIKTGTVHVVVASGMNVTLITKFVLNLLIGMLNRKIAVVFACLFAWWYAFLVGFEAPIVRATLMATIAFSALELGRLNESLRALFLTGFAMLFFNPQWVHDLGFYLSFASTSSLIVLSKPFYDRLSFVPAFFRENFANSLVAQIGVSPILIYFFGWVNIFSPVINALVLWTIVPITIMGLIGGFVGIVNISIGTFILYLTIPLSWVFLSVIDLFA
ncbi:MAG: ComEC/Rec2 family competence protein [Patescibacteria group bacterium]|nr:ComEC/Rec2 family competence protein [Patescibacteria group bacterium]